MKPVAQITDRAKRYRAQRNVRGEKRCVLCGARGRLDVMHLDGNESHGQQENLGYGCRSCNGKLAAAFKRIGAGVPTRQYNPASKRVPTFQQYVFAVANHTRGAHDDGGKVIHATPKHKRIEYARRIAELKGQRADARWNPIPAGAIAAVGDAAKYAAASEAVRRGTKIGSQLMKKAAKAAGMGRKRNPAAAAVAGYEEFHGREPDEFVTVTKQVHFHKHLSGAGKLKRLVVDPVAANSNVILSGWKGALLCFNEQKNQLFIEGGDQAVDLKAFGIDPKSAHEIETLGKVVTIDYFTTKDHLGDEGGEAVYRHKFRTTNEDGRHVTVRIARYPDLIYYVRDERLVFSGGSYEIRAEGVDL